MNKVSVGTIVFAVAEMNSDITVALNPSCALIDIGVKEAKSKI